MHIFLFLFFLTAVHPLPFRPSFTCDRPVDLIFVTDESGSINPITQWPLLIGFISELSLAFPSAFESSTGGVQLGYIGYSGLLTANSVPLGSIPNNTLFSLTVGGFARTGGGTATYLAIAEAGQQLLTRGRPAELGVSRLVIVLTDGDTNGGEPGTARTIASAQALRDLGITVAAVPVGTIVSTLDRARREMDGIVGGNRGLLFPVEDWNGLDNDTVVLDALARVACEAPVAPDAINVTVTTSIPCGGEIFFVWQPEEHFGSPVSLRGSVAGGIMRICWSYNNSRPLQPNADTFCSLALPGATAISTAAAFPPGAGDPAAAGPLFASLVALNTTNATDGTWSCGGSANLTVGFCHMRFAEAVPALPGAGVGGAREGLRVVDRGTPGESVCPSCPPNSHLLYPFLSGDFLSGVCAEQNCSGGGQYLSSPVLESRRPGFNANASAFTVCRDCHASCSAGGGGGGGQRTFGGGCVPPPAFFISAATGQPDTLGPLPPPVPPPYSAMPAARAACSTPPLTLP